MRGHALKRPMQQTAGREKKIILPSSKNKNELLLVFSLLCFVVIPLYGDRPQFKKNLTHLCVSLYMFMYVFLSLLPPFSPFSI